VSRPERAARLVLALAVGSLASGCGKGNLVSGAPERTTHRAVGHPRAGTGAAAPTPVSIPLKLTAARAEAFARAVNLIPVDVPGSHRSARSPSLQSQKEEVAGECADSPAAAVGGGRSAKLDRGSELETESVSSSVVVMGSAAAARRDLAYADSRAGLACYTELLRRRLVGESSATVHIGRVSVTPLRIGRVPRPQASGLRIEAQISGVKSGLTIGLFVDALGFDYGPAEIQLYATSFAQPIAARTEEDLLALMAARARLSRL